MKIKKNRFTRIKEFEGASFEIKAMTPGDLGRLLDISMKTGMASSDELRLQQAMDGVVGWADVDDENGVDIPYSDKKNEKKAALSMMLEFVPGFAEFVATSLNEVNKERDEENEALTKNS